MNLENLYLKKRRLDIAHKKVRLKLIKSERKSQFLMRKVRAKKLLMLGILVEKAEINHLPIETILGYLLKYTNISSEQEKLNLTRGKKLILTKSRAKKTRDVELEYMTYLEKKERAHKLISIGALLEIAGIDKKDKAALMGYLAEFNKKNPFEKEGYYESGTAELIKRKNNYRGRNNYGKKES